MATAAAVTAAVATVVGTGYSVYAGERQRDEQHKLQREQERAIKEEKAQALEQRKFQIDKQRMQLGGTGRGTHGASSTGIKARINTSETLG